MNCRLHIDVSRLEAKCLALASALEAEARTVLRDAVRRTLRRIDPGTEPYQRAQVSLWADLYRIFLPIDRPTRADGRIASIHRSLRRSRPAQRIAVSRAALDAHHARISARFGKANAGFNPAARISGYRPPGWIARHQPGQGSATWLQGPASLHLRIVNAVPYAPRLRSVRGRLSSAAPKARGEMTRAWRSRHLPTAIQKAGFNR